MEQDCSQRCLYCTKYSAFYRCPSCQSTYCHKGCYRLDKSYHVEKCPYLGPPPKNVKFIKPKDFKGLFGKFMSFVLYHWHRTYGTCYAECIVLTSKDKPKYFEWTIFFNKDVTRLGSEFTEGQLNFAAVEFDKEFLDQQGVTLKDINQITDWSALGVGAYSIETARNHYYYFNQKIDPKTIKKRITGVGINNKLGMYVGDKIFFLN